MWTTTLSKLLLSMTMVLAVVCSAQESASGQQNWQRFRVVKEGFSVLLPEVPVVVQRWQYHTGPPVRDARIYAAYRDGVGYTSDSKEDTDLTIAGLNEVSRKALILIKPEPRYTTDARKSGSEATLY